MAESDRRIVGDLTTWSLVALIACFAVFLFWTLTKSGADLRAIWTAAQVFAEGLGDKVYPDPSPIFRMRPPDEWAPIAARDGYDAGLVPYLYPPLLAELLAPVTRIMEFDQFRTICTLIWPALIVASIVMAHRVSGSGYSLTLWSWLSLLVVGTTEIGIVTFTQLQPQALVVFLVIAALYLEKRGAPIGAGAVMAVAAALKIYPAIFALMWLAQGKARPFVACVIAGLGCLAVSILLGGWAIHLDFLATLKSINNSASVNGGAFNVDAVIATVFHYGAFVAMPALYVGAPAHAIYAIMIQLKSPLWSALTTLSILAVVAVMFAMFRRNRRLDARIDLIWPAAMTTLAVMTPLSLSYHFLAPLLFAPRIVEVVGGWRGWALLALILVPMNLYRFPVTLDAVTAIAGADVAAIEIRRAAIAVLAVMGCFVMVLYAAIFYRMAWAGRNRPGSAPAGSGAG